jgi:hypothetical protein
MSPLLRYIVTINTNNAIGHQQTSEWQLSSNTHSDHLTSTLESLMRDVKEPVRVAAAARQKAKPNSSVKNQDKQNQSNQPTFTNGIKFSFSACFLPLLNNNIVNTICQMANPTIHINELVGCCCQVTA